MKYFKLFMVSALMGYAVIAHSTTIVTGKFFICAPDPVQTIPALGIYFEADSFFLYQLPSTPSSNYNSISNIRQRGTLLQSGLYSLTSPSATLRQLNFESIGTLLVNQVVLSSFYLSKLTSGELVLYFSELLPSLKAHPVEYKIVFSQHK